MMKCWENVHGNIIINATKNPNMIAIWTIKVRSRASHAFIGIHSVYVPGSVCYGGIETNYGWCSRGVMLGTDIGRNVNTFGDGDMIRMELNVEQRDWCFIKMIS